MASAIYSESGYSDQGRRLSLSVDSPASASPFPSPSSSFLPPPTPGAHEFAVKPPPPGRNGRKSSNAHVFKKEDDASGMNESKSTSQRSSVDSGVFHVNGSAAKGSTPSSPTLSPSTPTTSSLQRHVLMNNHEIAVCASTPSATTPTTANAHIPEPPTNGIDNHPNPPPITIPDLTSPTSQTTQSQTLSTGDAVLTPIRPAPPSPAISRRVSGAPSTYSTRSRSSRPPSAAVSRANSVRKTAVPSSPTNRRFSQLSSGHYPTSSSPLASPLSGTFPNMVTSPSPAPASQNPPPNARVRIKIRDFAFDVNDERHLGAGPLVPKANRVGRLNKQLGAARMSTGSIGSWESSDGGEEEEEEDVSSGGWGGFEMGVGRFSWNMGAGAAPAGKVGEDGYPSKNDLAMNFFTAEDEEEDIFHDAVEGDDEEEPLYPGLYRALYAFEPEGTAEMALEEDQVVRVVGKGGGVGWALVLDERLGQGESSKHALVPESYLEPIRFDYEDEQTAVPE